MLSISNLNTCFFICTNNKFIRFQRSLLPNSMVQIEHTPSFLFKEWISGEYPASILPRFYGIFIKPTPDGCPTDLGNNSSMNSLHCNISRTESRQRNIFIKWQFTSQCFDLYYHIRGKKRTDVRFLANHQDCHVLP